MRGMLDIAKTTAALSCPFLSCNDFSQLPLSDFIVAYDAESSENNRKEPTITHVIEYVRDRLKGKDREDPDKLNKVIPMMRFGSVQEQEDYYNFCIIVQDIMSMPTQDHKEERKKLLKKAKSKVRPTSSKKS